MGHVVTILPSVARTASDVGTAWTLPSRVKGLVFLFDLTAAHTDAGDLLNVYIQD
jgi:hypothetical protein